MASDTEILQDILQGQAAMQESVKSMAEMIREVREDSRLMRQAISDSNQTIAFAQAEIRHIREEHDRYVKDNAATHDLIYAMIKEEVQAAWDERRRCAADRKESGDALSKQILEKVELRLERMKAQVTVAILVYAITLIGFFIKEKFF